MTLAERIRIEPTTVLRTGGGIALGIVSTVIGRPYGVPADLLLLLAALVLAPLDLLPVVVITLIRRHDTVLGPLTLSDLAAIAYLVRLACSRRILGVGVTASRVVLALFFMWTVLVTLTGLGQQSTIGWLAVYACLGIMLTYSPTAKRWLYAGVLGLAAVELVLYVPQFPSRFFGRYVNDPAHMGFLLVCGLIIVATSDRPRRLRRVLAAVLVFGILCTFTRSVWFATTCVTAAAVLPRRWWVPLALPPALAGLFLPLVSLVTQTFHLNTGSAGIRLAGFAAGLEEFRRHPLTGQGWAAAAAAQARGIGGISQLPVYDLWIYLGGAVGLVGLLLFLVYCGLLGRESLTDPVAYLSLTAALGMSLTEMPLYAGSLIAVLMLTMPTTRPRAAAHQATDRPFRPPVRAAADRSPHFARHHRRAPYYRTGARA
ncbi:hypothetical protein Dvina_22215 [Dactylosporangium vinaceum]|uniref:Integral membrane protein n=1 Tax=Dactylosporangium vinaceum TaxID=53362 RepID=A0ABV5MR79_9ACTN|nr:hypothetical protein [Dactylosporangium vinaceum]UAC00526.1 hypothetical protein Dvina_22215 [Dactylosporangium vinaceum]